jgi:hypothetical protein
MPTWVCISSQQEPQPETHVHYLQSEGNSSWLTGSVGENEAVHTKFSAEGLVRQNTPSAKGAASRRIPLVTEVRA